MKINQGFRAEGTASYKVINSAGDITQNGDCDNLVLDNFYTWLLVPNQQWGVPVIKLGTGTSEPTAGQTELGAEGKVLSSVSMATPNAEIIAGKLHAKAIISKDSGIGGATGNWTELGLCWTTGVQTRLLFKDTAGQPVAITVRNDEQLVITYTVTVIFDMTTTVTTENWAGESRTVTAMTGDRNYGLDRLFRIYTEPRNDVYVRGLGGSFGTVGTADSRTYIAGLLASVSKQGITNMMTMAASSVDRVVTGFDVRNYAVSMSKIQIEPPILWSKDTTMTVQFIYSRSRSV